MSNFDATADIASRIMAAMREECVSPGNGLTITELARATGVGHGALSARLQAWMQGNPRVRELMPGLKVGRDVLQRVCVWREAESKTAPPPRCAIKVGHKDSEHPPLASFSVQHRGKCVSHVEVCGAHLPQEVRRLSKGCGHEGCAPFKPGILHVEVLR